jgi:glutamate---cysteine ligase / carboxylate-amine ligase
VRGEEYPSTAIVERLLAWTAPVRAELSLDPVFPDRNGAQRQRRLIEAGATREEVYSVSVRDTLDTYSQEVTV